MWYQFGDSAGSGPGLWITVCNTDSGISPPRVRRSRSRLRGAAERWRDCCVCRAARFTHHTCGPPLTPAVTWRVWTVKVCFVCARCSEEVRSGSSRPTSPRSGSVPPGETRVWTRCQKGGVCLRNQSSANQRPLPAYTAPLVYYRRWTLIGRKVGENLALCCVQVQRKKWESWFLSLESLCWPAISNYDTKHVIDINLKGTDHFLMKPQFIQLNSIRCGSLLCYFSSLFISFSHFIVLFVVLHRQTTENSPCVKTYMAKK